MRNSLIILLYFTSFICFGQIPDGYYDAAIGKSGEELRIILRDITKAEHVKLPYTSTAFDVWDAYTFTDVRETPNDTIIWDMYSDIPSDAPLYTFTVYTDQCGTSSFEGACYAREHQMPNSWWGGLDNSSNPQYTDLHHLPPADQYVNNKKSAHPIGTVDIPTWTSTNGSKIGPCSWTGYNGTVFEPIDEYKGDFARAYLYLATRYMDYLSTWVNTYPSTESHFVIDSINNNYKAWFIDMLLTWSYNDPVSAKEIKRNNAIYYNTNQHNRNPYIDHPEYADLIWSTTVGINKTNQSKISISPNPTKGLLHIESNKDNWLASVYNIDGKLLKTKISNKNSDTLNIESLLQGVYIIKIKTSVDISTFMIVKD